MHVPRPVSTYPDYLIHFMQPLMQVVLFPNLLWHLQPIFQLQLFLYRLKQIESQLPFTFH